MKTNLIFILVLLIAVVLAAGVRFKMKEVSALGRVSRFGEYRGYTESSYDDYERRSDYLLLEDGTRLAYDVLLPTKVGAVADGPFPTLFTHTPYLRAFLLVDEGEVAIENLVELNWVERTFLRLRARLVENGHIGDAVFRNGWLDTFLRHGYAVVAVERAGTGASSGVINPSFRASAEEADQILDWIAAQPWSDGNVGMFGDSYEAMTQLAAASTGNPHLKAIFPVSCSFDMYDSLIYRGGIYNKGFGDVVPDKLAALEGMIVPVDSDPDGSVLVEILREREVTFASGSSRANRASPYRDSWLADGRKLWDEAALYPLLDDINEAGVPVYLSTGWYDIFTRDVMLWYANLRTPKKLHIRPGAHEELMGSASDLDFKVEALRWFDFWLKGIDNGVMDEPPVMYWLMGAPEEDAWQASKGWPLSDQETTRFYLQGGTSGSVGSSNDGLLGVEVPTSLNAVDFIQVDYTTTTGLGSRWARGLDGAVDYPEMGANDAKALAYTSKPLKADVVLVGHPVAHLWLASEAPDLDVFVYLEVLDSGGKASYLTEGNLRTSHRALSEPPFDNLGLPFHRHFESDLASLPAGEPVELLLDLLPTARLFHTGESIRVTIAFADADNFETPVLDLPPEVSILRNAEHTSFVELPVVIGN